MNYKLNKLLIMNYDYKGINTTRYDTVYVNELES